ncbi:MAG: hypothetical protein O7E52_07410 [Candidatus Poribacteria bacterium]|nr:hypothetical protein [Candidatus Poribacteria bacterium]
MLQRFAILITLLMTLFFIGCYTQLGSRPMAFERGLSRTDSGTREAMKAEEEQEAQVEQSEVPDLQSREQETQTEADAEREFEDEENYYSRRTPDAYDDGYEGYYYPYDDPYYGGYYSPYRSFYSPYYYGGYYGYYGGYGGYGGVHHYDYLVGHHNGRANYGLSRRGVGGRSRSTRRVMNRSRLAGSPRTRIRNDAQAPNTVNVRRQNGSGQPTRFARVRSSRSIRSNATAPRARSYRSAPSRSSQVRGENRLRSSGRLRSRSAVRRSGAPVRSRTSRTSHTSHSSHRGH